MSIHTKMYLVWDAKIKFPKNSHIKQNIDIYHWNFLKVLHILSKNVRQIFGRLNIIYSYINDKHIEYWIIQWAIIYI